MKYIICSDIHSNLEAFQAVIAEAKKEGADQYILLGDLVGYGPNPNECIQEAINFANISIAGNHDHAALGLTEVTFFNNYAQSAIFWTRRLLTPKSWLYLEKLPMSQEGENTLFIHATIKDPPLWGYIFSPLEALDNFNFFTQQVCFIGHSHFPTIYVLDPTGNCQQIPFTQLVLEEGYRYIINDGSVGQPRDRNPKACYVVYDTTTKKVELRRVAYDYAITQEKILAAGLPPYLANRLAFGV